jgi:glycerol transport system permease protein
MFEWMAWTLPVAVFFCSIVLMLIGMTVWELKSPTVERKGWLPITTTRGDRLFIGLLTNRMTPPAVFLLPFFQLYTTLGMMDTHVAVALAHLVFNVPLAVWILEGFMSGIPREIDETAYIDGYSFPRFFLTIFIPLIKAGVGVAAFFCFMFSWVELLLAKTLTSVDAKPIAATMTRTASTSGYELGLLAAAGALTIVPGAVVIYFVRNYIAKGFAMGRV